MKENIKSLDFLGFPDYSISDQGNLYSHISINYENNHISGKKYDANTLRLITPTIQQCLHHDKQIRLSKNGNRIIFNISFLVASAFIKNPNNFKDVDFLDNDNNNLKSDNLIWIEKKPYLTPGFTFTSSDGSICKVIAQTDKKHIDVLLTSENVVGDIKGIILNTTIASIKNKYVKHPFICSVKNYGCLGIGPYKISETINGKEIKNTIYSRWFLMITRCFCDIESSYYKTPISEEFRNFQNYAHFINILMTDCNIKSLDNFDIDKDFKNNKLLGYSRETITLVPDYLNSFLSNRNIGSGVLPTGVGYSPSRNEIRSTLVDDIGTTLKWFKYSNDININIITINTLIDLYVKQKSIKAKELLLKCYNDYPNIKLDTIVISILNNFENYVIDNYYFKYGWEVQMKNGNYQLSSIMLEKVKNALC